MLQRSDGCCRDETLGGGRGVAETERGGGRLCGGGWRRGEGRSVAWWGRSTVGLMLGRSRDGIEARDVSRAAKRDR
jgi:hypothetical protein